MVIRKYSPFSITAKRNRIDGIGKLSSQFSSHDERVSVSKKAVIRYFLFLGLTPDLTLKGWLTNVGNPTIF